MKMGDTVFFITKGVVRAGTLVRIQEGKVALIRYTKGDFQKYYHYKVSQVATELEGGINGRLSKGSDTSSNKGCNTKDNKVSGQLQSDKEGQNSSNKLFVGAWRIRNMA